jgi:hypothetical protein
LFVESKRLIRFQDTCIIKFKLKFDLKKKTKTGSWVYDLLKGVFVYVSCIKAIWNSNDVVVVIINYLTHFLT